MINVINEFIAYLTYKDSILRELYNTIRTEINPRRIYFLFDLENINPPRYFTLGIAIIKLINEAIKKLIPNTLNPIVSIKKNNYCNEYNLSYCFI